MIPTLTLIGSGALRPVIQSANRDAAALHPAASASPQLPNVLLIVNAITISLAPRVVLALDINPSA